MAQVTIEYMIMIPVLIMQIFLFPLTASIIMDAWTDSRMTLELQDTAGYLSSSIQQLYHTINHASIASGSVRIILDIPPLIDGYAYTVTLRHVQHSDSAAKIMNITLKYIMTDAEFSTLVTLGENVDWQENMAFNSTSNSLVMVATKTANNIWLSLGGS
ncbi:MAG: hypothetical protein NWE98_02575 [Candidatus Bathyarchaeota archaeon]|nr:hypothetical protein [Candidatus Bathyarchaeota archaeon]